MFNTKYVYVFFFSRFHDLSILIRRVNKLNSGLSSEKASTQGKGMEKETIASLFHSKISTISPLSREKSLQSIKKHFVSEKKKFGRRHVES